MDFFRWGLLTEWVVFGEKNNIVVDSQRPVVLVLVSYAATKTLFIFSFN